MNEKSAWNSRLFPDSIVIATDERKTEVKKPEYYLHDRLYEDPRFVRYARLKFESSFILGNLKQPINNNSSRLFGSLLRQFAQIASQEKTGFTLENIRLLRAVAFDYYSHPFELTASQN